MRGAETILVSPNSAIGIPKDAKDGMATTIIQQSGSILLEVEKRNVKHFEVETPYLAAVVKGTQFRVTVEQGASRVDVAPRPGRSDGLQVRPVRDGAAGPGRAGFGEARPVLSLSGSGTLSPVQQGTPRLASVSPLQALTETAAAPEKKPAGPQARAVSAQIDSEWMRIVAAQPGPGQQVELRTRIPRAGCSAARMAVRPRPRTSTLPLAFSLAIGGAVAIAVGAQRRRKSRKTIQS